MFGKFSFVLMQLKEVLRSVKTHRIQLNKQLFWKHSLHQHRIPHILSWPKPFYQSEAECMTVQWYDKGFNLHVNEISFSYKKWARRLALRKRLEVHVIQKYFKWGSERNIKGISWYAVCIMRTSICNLSIVCLFIVIESEVCICLRLLCLGFYSTFISYWLIQS